MKDKEYVLITAAHNEEALIANAMRAVITQSVTPNRWVIVSDGSTDHTDEIVESFSKKYSFIELMRLDGHSKRNFKSQVHAINAGYGRVKNHSYRFVGNVDADITFGIGYFESIIERFDRNPKLGLAGGWVHERVKGVCRSRVGNYFRHVPHAIQLFRRECFEEIGGYLPLKYGGPDTHAEITARMKGWEVEAFPEIPVFHHRPTSACEGFLQAAFRQGKMDQSLGYHPVFEILKCFSRARMKPYILYALTQMIGFIGSYCRRDEVVVSHEFIRYLRKEQMDRLRKCIIRHGSGS
jgi:glycosyltransferase involved in cell wall biosynthesis